MRLFAVIAALTLLVPATAEARLFWQTYGATVATLDGCGWNMNQDYFVPRHCDSCRYDLFSPCKTAHTISPACKNLHPVYAGYCTPYGAWHYKRRDHVYKKYCGCTPWSHVYGKWHLEKCCKPCRWKHGRACEEGHSIETSCTGNSYGCADSAVGVESTRAYCLCNVEPMGAELLGSIAALPAGSSASGGMTPAVGLAPPASGTASPLPPPLNLSPAASGSGSLPAPFKF